MRLGELATYCPDSGDIIWLDLLQVVGSEQAGRRLRWCSRRAFNELTGRCVACPIGTDLIKKGAPRRDSFN
jgi:mRNA-degrading endonuclease toxin of MazEF toxin-antitoxin module